MCVTKHGDKASACTPIQQATSFCRAQVLFSHAEIDYRTFHSITEYTEQIDESLSGVTKVITLVKPLNNKTESKFTKDKTNSKGFSI